MQKKSPQTEFLIVYLRVTYMIKMLTYKYTFTNQKNNFVITVVTRNSIISHYTLQILNLWPCI